MTSRAAPLLALALPAACLGAAELISSVLSAGTDRPYVAHLGGWLLLAQMAAGLLAGLAFMLVAQRRPLPLAPAVCLGAAAGLGVALGTLTVLANGLPRRVPPGTVPPALAWGAALGLGAAAGVLRWLAARRRHGPLALMAEPPLLAVALVGTYGFLRLQRIPPATLEGAGLWLGAILAALILGAVLGRVRLLPSPRAHFLLLIAVGGLAAGLLASARSPFPAVPARGGERPDILLVVMDTTRADALPAAGAWPTPAAARLAAEGRTYARCFSTSCWTVPAHGSLFTGRLPRGHGASWSHPQLPTGPATLAERLAAAGWRTAGFSANPWIGSEFGFDRGFDHFVEANADRRPLRPWASAFLPAALTLPALDLFDDKGGLALVSEALRHLDRAGEQPVFTYLNLLEPHLPYLPPRRYRDRVAAEFGRADVLALDQEPLTGLVPERSYDDRQMAILRALYAAEVSYADELLDRMLRRLAESGRLDRTVVVLTSDHGENLGDHPPLDHQLGLGDSLVHVPLLLRFPGVVPAGSQDDALLSLTDLPGAILRLAGAGPPAEDTGADATVASLLPAGRPAVYFQYARPGPILDRIASHLGIDPEPWDRALDGVRTVSGKWIRASDGRHQAFDLAADPRETTNLYGGLLEPREDPPGEGDPDALEPRWRELAEQLESRLPARDEAAPGATLNAITPETRERLRSLGYLD